MIGKAEKQEPCLSYLREADSDCGHCTLRHAALFAGVHAPDLEKLRSQICHGVLRRGTVIYSAGEAGQAVYTVRTGVVKLVMDVPGREKRIVRLLGRGATLGLEVLAGRLYAHSAVTLRTSSLCRIPIETVDTLHLHNPQLVHALMHKWNEQMVWADRWIALLGSGTVPQRLTELVRLVADISGDSLRAVHLPPIADIAAILGVAGESVSRHLAEFKRAGLLTHVGPRIYRFDPALLDANQAQPDAPVAATVLRTGGRRRRVMVAPPPVTPLAPD